MIATVAGRRSSSETGSFLHERNVAHPNEMDEKIAEFESDGKTAMLVARGNVACGIIAVADTLKETSESRCSGAERIWGSKS